MKNFIKQQSANGLITLRPTHLLIGKLANLLIFLLIFVSCSKSDNNDTPTPTDPASYYIELTTEKAVGEKIKLDVGTDKADEAGVW